ncbi:protein kinase domain-containing protein [Ruminococcus sp.]|uniref:protein kinase domain-containing protein n=1 Tax=Ruminococcus sp. TaxID=41978 RepID=UPI002E814C30|nr:protein kinase [Ruminococcus sp.]MEE3492602.1 protein kinase [Ruminococcus sp.]
MLCFHCMHEKGDAEICPHCHAQGSVEPQPHQIVPGTVIGNRYTLGNVIGEGGFGITYIGLDNTLGVTVAVKEYYPFGWCDRNTTAGNTVAVTSDDKSEFFEKGRSRFLNEARTLAGFQKDPGVVDVIDCLEENHTAYIVMEYLYGITLREYLKQNGTLAPDQAVRMLLPSMRALAKIHNAGVIHRDISPDNIMMLRDGSLKLMGFGTARDYDNADNRSTSNMLRQGYAPAEQYRRNDEQGPWTDVYGMCATIYRAITGITPVDSIDRVQQDTLRRPSQCGVNISPAMGNALMYGMAVNRENRCPDMPTLIGMFEQALSGQPTAFAGAAFVQGNRTMNPNQTVAANAYQPRYPQNDPRFRQGYQRPPVQGYRPPMQQYPPEQPMPKKSSATPWIIGILVFLAVISAVVAAVVFFTRNNHHDEPSSSIIEAETIETLKMPDLSGLTKEEAIKKLSDLNLSVDSFTETEVEDEEAGEVFSQVPKTDTEVTPDTKIKLYIAKAPATEAKKEEKDTPVKPSPSSTTMFCTARSYVTVHSSASTGSADLGKIYIGDSVKVLSSSSGWLYIDDGEIRGYASAAYFSSSASMVPQYTDPLYVDSDVDFLSLRASASENSAELVKIPPGAKMIFLGAWQDNGYVRSDGYHVRWAKVSYGGKQGYVYDYYLHD